MSFFKRTRQEAQQFAEQAIRARSWREEIKPAIRPSVRIPSIKPSPTPLAPPRPKTQQEIYAEERKVRVQQLKEGTHPQQWRQEGPTPAKTLQGPGATLGPMGAFSNDIIFEISITSMGYQMLQQLQGILSMNSLIREFRKEVYEVLQDYIDLKIDTWVPMDSGDLRESMHNSITPSQSGTSLGQGFPFRMVLGTPGINYAKPVNKMITSWLVHPAPYHRNVGRFGDPLNDPDAKQGWYNLVLVNGRNQARQLIQQYFNTISLGLNKVFRSQSYNYARQMFTVRYL